MNDQTKQVISWNVNDGAIHEIAEQCKGVDAYENFDEAKAAKKALTKMRSRLAEAHKETKAEALAFGRLVDGEKNRLLALILEIEDPISDQLNAIKNKAILEEAERVQTITENIEKIQEFAEDRHSLDLDQLKERRSTLGVLEITEEVYQEMIESAQLAKDEADLKLRLAIDAEVTRIEEERKAAEMAEENRLLREELDKSKAEQAERDAVAKAEQDKKDAIRQAEMDAEQAEIAKEREAIDKENAAIAERRAIEMANELAIAQEAERLAQAPDREKLLVFATSVDHLINTKPTLDTGAANNILFNAVAMLIEVAHDIRTSTEEMK